MGIKLCVGRPEEMASLVRGFVEVEEPDFITVDGAEGVQVQLLPNFQTEWVLLSRGIKHCERTFDRCESQGTACESSVRVE